MNYIKRTNNVKCYFIDEKNMYKLNKHKMKLLKGKSNLYKSIKKYITLADNY